MRRVYLDYAATTPVLPEVIEAMAPYWSEKFGNASSVHSWGREARVAVEESRKKVAEVLNCDSEEIIFTGTTTTSDNLAILGVANFQLPTSSFQLLRWQGGGRCRRRICQ